MSEERKVIAILGVGPGLGAAIARRFAAEGFAVGLMARKTASVAPVRQALEAAGHQATAIEVDATNARSVAGGFAQLSGTFGAPEVFVYNAGAFVMGGVLEITPEQFEQTWRANCLGGFLGAQQALPAMLKRGRGTVLLTGATASLRGSARFACLAVGKFGLRALAQSMAREFGPQGIHVAHVVVDGQIGNPRTRARFSADRPEASFLAPDAIAESYWRLHAQDPSAWTLELDLRPAVEKF
jgi:NAD(P)-dependent dehydrogenase (short-subunit alcohol dehydrogenase family)